MELKPFYYLAKSLTGINLNKKIMNRKLIQTILYVCFILCIQIGFTSCKNDSLDPYKSAKEAIIGKWEIIEIGNWPDMSICSATGYIEYKPNGIVYSFDYDQGDYTSEREYWVDSLLHESITREDGFKLVFDFDYEFIDSKLRKDARAFMIFNTSIYQRIE